MKRTQWEFAYTADELLKAATAKKLFHEGRLKWWTEEQDKIKDKIKEEGIEISESVADRAGSYSNNLNAVHYRGPVAQINNKFLEDLSEITMKKTEHQGKVKDYDAWCQVLSSQGQHVLQLNQDDWLFFFGK